MHTYFVVANAEIICCHDTRSWILLLRIVVLSSLSRLRRQSTTTPRTLNHIHHRHRHRHHRPSCNLRSSPAPPINYPHHRSDNTPRHTHPRLMPRRGRRSIVRRRTSSSPHLILLLSILMKYPKRLQFHVTGGSLYLQISIWSGVA